MSRIHQKLNFVSSIDRQYDKSFAESGAKIGSTLRIRNPVQYTVSNGPTLAVQNSVETNTTLTVNNQTHTDMSFSSQELTLNIDDFTARYIEPAIAVIASNIEGTVLSQLLPSVYNVIPGNGSAQTFRNILLAGKQLQDNLAPTSKLKKVRLNTQDNVDLVDSLKGLFQDSKSIAAQYTDGVMGVTGGFEMGINTLIPSFTPGARSQTYTISGAAQTGAALAVATGTGAMVAGDAFTVPGVFRVHPETKSLTTTLQQFVVTTAYAGGAGTINISPAIVTTGAFQNVSNSPANGAVLTFAGTAGTTTGQSLAYHPDAFTFATADLIMPGGVDMASRITQDGISMRIIRQYDINNDVLPCRVDVLWGAAPLRPQLAARMLAN